MNILPTWRKFHSTFGDESVPMVIVAMKHVDFISNNIANSDILLAIIEDIGENP